jgi:hypothetical protein
MKILGFRVPLPRTKAPAPAGSDKTHAGGPSAGVLAAARAGSHRGPQDATLVSAGEKPAPGAPRLVVTRGPRKGTELALLHDVATLGRGRENSLVIPDISVSRRHARLQRAGGRWRVLDEGSGNGILVNGAPEHGCLLRDGDEIALGDTRLQFVDSGGVVARGRPAARRLRSVAPLAVACCLAAGVLAAAGIVHLRRTRHAAEMARDHHQQSRALAQRQLHAGTTLLSAGRKAEARIKLAVASELDPADAEIAHAMEALVREEAAGSQAPPPASRKEPAAAATVRPHHIRAAKAAPPPHAAAANPQPADAGLQAARSAYLGGDLAGAAARAKAAPGSAAERLAHGLEEFERDCRQAAAQPSPAEAIRWLETAAAADRAISGGAESRLGREVEKALSAQHLLAAAALDADEQLPQTAAHVRAAAAADPSNAAAREAQRGVAERARGIYLRGYVVREADVEEARKAFRLVIEALPAGDEVAQKAKRWLDKLEPKAAE